jgi:hypothetical protein
VTANVALVAIAAVFLNSYLARVVRMPVYWLPAVGLVGSVALYFVRTRAAGSSSFSSSTLRRRRSRLKREGGAPLSGLASTG